MKVKARVRIQAATRRSCAYEVACISRRFLPVKRAGLVQVVRACTSYEPRPFLIEAYAYVSEGVLPGLPPTRFPQPASGSVPAGKSYVQFAEIVCTLRRDPI